MSNLPWLAIMFVLDNLLSLQALLYVVSHLDKTVNFFLLASIAINNLFAWISFDKHDIS